MSTIYVVPLSQIHPLWDVLCPKDKPCKEEQEEKGFQYFYLYRCHLGDIKQEEEAEVEL